MCLGVRPPIEIGRENAIGNIGTIGVGEVVVGAGRQATSNALVYFFIHALCIFSPPALYLRLCLSLLIFHLWLSVFCFCVYVYLIIISLYSSLDIYYWFIRGAE